jgi:adenylate cyclase
MSARRRRVAVRAGACVVISVMLAVLAGALTSTGFLQRFEGTASDEVFARGEADDSIAVVAIDAEALIKIDPTWPWPRSLHAQLVRALDAAGAKVIAFDIGFVTAAPGDAELVDAVREAGNVVLVGSVFSEIGEGEAIPGAGVAPAEERPNRNERGVLRSTVIPPIEPLREAALGVAHPQVVLDPADGVVRELPLVIEDQDERILPALSLAALAAANGSVDDLIIRRPSGVQTGMRAIPTDAHYDLRLSYTAGLDDPRTIGPTVSAADVLLGDLEPDKLRDKVVFIGVTDVSLGDRVQTPVAKSAGLPGVKVQATGYHTMASQNYLTDASQLEVAMWVLAVSLLVTLAVQFLPAWLGGFVALGAMATFLFAAFLRSATGTVANFTYIVVAVVLAVPLSGAVRYFVETRQRRRVAALFSQYVPARVAEQLMDEGTVDRVTEGQRLNVTAMFCDLRGFTERSSRMEPTQVNEMLGDFYEYGSALVLAHNGTVMTYIGDEIFAIFGAPVPSTSHAEQAVACALEMQTKIHELDERLAPHGFDPLRFGIGLNAGEVVASHAGSTWRRQYTAIGTTVNVASRLCSKAAAGEVVVSQSVRSEVHPAPPAEQLPAGGMKGVSEDFVAWKLIMPGEATDLDIDLDAIDLRSGSITAT